MSVLAIANPRPIGRPVHDAARHLTPNWFAATMGTGVLALVLHQVAPDSPLATAIGETVWAANIGLFVFLSALHVARWVLFPNESRRMLDDPVMPMFFGCIPMGLATIISGAVAFVPPGIGSAAMQSIEALWWIDAGLAVAVGLFVPFLMFTRQAHSLERMTAVWLLPIVAAEVAGTCGGLVVPHIAGAGHQFLILAASYMLWACSVPMAFAILTILVLRLALHKLPDAAMAPSCWLALGPIGTGALGLLVLGGAAPTVLVANGLGALSVAIPALGIVGGLLLWGCGAWWAALALLITARYLWTGFAFNLGWWGYTFPLGVFTLATLKLSSVLPLPILRTFGDVLVIALTLVWLMVAARTLAMVAGLAPLLPPTSDGAGSTPQYANASNTGETSPPHGPW